MVDHGVNTENQALKMKKTVFTRFRLIVADVSVILMLTNPLISPVNTYRSV